MSEEFRYKDFRAFISDMLDEFDEPMLDRAWEIVRGCVVVHARVDRRSDETLNESHRLAWLEVVRAFAGEDCTCTVWGLHEEIRHALGDRYPEFQRRFLTIASRCGGEGLEPGPGSPPEGTNTDVPRLTPTRHSHLSVVE